ATLLKSVAVRFRDVDTKNRATLAASPTPTRIANQILMQLVTWGEALPNGARSAPWSRVAAELEAQLGAAPLAAFGAATRYDFTIDVGTDRVTIPDPTTLAARLRTDLG